MALEGVWVGLVVGSGANPCGWWVLVVVALSTQFRSASWMVLFPVEGFGFGAAGFEI
jgi:hypothetical protein